MSVKGTWRGEPVGWPRFLFGNLHLGRVITRKRLFGHLPVDAPHGSRCWAQKFGSLRLGSADTEIRFTIIQYLIAESILFDDGDDLAPSCPVETRDCHVVSTALWHGLCMAAPVMLAPAIEPASMRRYTVLTRTLPYCGQ